MGCFSSDDVRQLLHNKFVVILGDSIQRSVYKDLVKLLRGDQYLSEKQLKDKGERSFENDMLVEGGKLGGLHNGVTFREVRQYRTGSHLVRFYFLTRAYSDYLESVLADFQRGPQPDVVIANSCIWDVIRYRDPQMEEYITNLDHLFLRLTEVLSPECLVVWNMTMPVGFKYNEIPENMQLNLRWDIVAGNFFGAFIANFHRMDVLDMHYHFRFDLRSRCKDGVHWNQLAHRKYTQILLTHIAQAWGVEAPDSKKTTGGTYIPGYMGFDGRSVDAETFHPGYFSFENDYIPTNAAQSFVDDSPMLVSNIPPGYMNVYRNRPTAAPSYVDASPVLVGDIPPQYMNVYGNRPTAAPSFADDDIPVFGDIPPGYFNFDESRTNVSGPIYNHQFPGMGILPHPYGMLPNRVPLEVWNGRHRFVMKSRPRYEDGRIRPYYQPAPFLSRIY